MPLARLTLVPATPLSSPTTLGESIKYATRENSVLIFSSHYIENTSKDEDLVWIEIYKSDRVADISLSQWLALTPPDIAAQTLKVPVDFIEKIKKEKQFLIE